MGTALEHVAQGTATWTDMQQIASALNDAENDHMRADGAGIMGLLAVERARDRGCCCKKPCRMTRGRVEVPEWPA